MLKLRQSINETLKKWDDEIDSQAREGKSDNFLLALIRARNRWRCRNDLLYLCEIVGQDKVVSIPRYYEPFCDEVSLMNWQVLRLGLHPPNEDILPIENVTDNPEKDLERLQRLYLCFRTFWKTTIISKVHSIQLLINFNNIHIVLAHNKQENASALLVAIKNMFLTTSLKYWFPECIPQTKEWGSMSEFSLANRTDWGREEQSIEAIGVDTEITGGHWQVAKKNDLVTEKSVGTEEQIKKSIDWDERFNIGQFDDPKIKLQDYEGTRYHFSDMYSKKLGDPNIKFIKIPLLNDFEDNSSCPLPERYTPEDIRKLKETNPWVFWTQMMLEPKDPAKMRFTPEMIKTYTEVPEGCNYYLLVDPASARKKKSDFTVMKVVAIGWFKLKGEDTPILRKAIVDGLRDKLDPKQRVDEAIRLARRWSVKGIGWEAIAFQSTDCFYFEAKRREYKGIPTPQEIKSHSVSKEDRIRALMPEYAQHKWLWPPKGTLVNISKFDGKTYDLTEEQEYEFLHFPLGAHDDLLDTDTFLNLMDITKPSPPKDKEEITDMTFGEYHGLMDDRRKSLRLNPWQRFHQPSYR